MATITPTTSNGVLKMTEYVTIEVLISDAERTLHELCGYSQAFVDLKYKEEEPYILTKAICLIGDYIELLKGQKSEENLK